MVQDEAPDNRPLNPAPGGGFAKAGSVVTAALFLILVAVPLIAGMPTQIWHAAALTVLAIGLWATGYVPMGITAMMFFLAAMLLDVQPAGVVFSGFQSSALWLVFGGLVIGVAVQHTGLGARLAGLMSARVGTSYLGVLSAVGAISLLLSFVMPSSMGRILLIIPIVISYADKLGFAPGGRGRSGMVMVAALVTFVAGGTILTAHVPGMILAGASETLYGLTLPFSGYLKINFPVMGALRCAAIVGLGWWLFNDRPRGAPDAEGPGPMTSAQKRLTAVLIAALALWLSDSIHGVSPAWIALGAAVYLLFPGGGLTPGNTLNQKLDYNSLFYVAAVLGLSAVLTGSGLAAVAGQWLFSLVPLEAAAAGSNYASLTGLSTVMGLVVTNPGTPAVLSPLARDIAALTELPLNTVLMTQVTGFTNIVLPYQASPVIVAMAMGGVRLAEATKITIALTVITLVLLAPINYLWWSWLGLFGPGG